MRKLVVCGLVAGLVLSAFVVPGVAKKKPKPKPKPVATSLWFHGEGPVGEVENAQYLAGALPTGNWAYMPMDSTEPTGSGASMGLTTYVGGPNTQCAGSNLFPTWVGEVVGTVKGDVKVTFFATASPGSIVDVRVWPDLIALTCNADLPPPAREAFVEIPPGQTKVEVVMPGDPFKAAGKLMVAISPAAGPAPGSTSAFLGRVDYDSPTKNSGMSFGCIPPKGSTACVK